jgi:hypothetical protein
MNNYNATNEKGLVVFIHNSRFKPTEAIFVEPGKNTYIGVKREVTQKYPSPYSDCIDLDSYKSDLYDYITKTQKKAYRQQDCFELCIQKEIINNCECYYTKYDDLNTNVTACLNQVNFYCLEGQIDNFILTECQKNLCPLECDSISYELSLSSLVNLETKDYTSAIESDYFEEYYDVNTTNTNSIINSNLVYVTVYYPSLQYEKIIESPKTQIFDLFTQIGGALGMFVSFSVFTIFELIEIFLLIVKELIIGNKSQKLNQTNA